MVISLDEQINRVKNHYKDLISLETPKKCPFCGSDDIEVTMHILYEDSIQSMNLSYFKILWDVKCNSCGKSSTISTERVKWLPMWDI